MTILKSNIICLFSDFFFPQTFSCSAVSREPALSVDSQLSAFPLLVVVAIHFFSASSRFCAIFSLLSLGPLASPALPPEGGGGGWMFLKMRKSLWLWCAAVLEFCRVNFSGDSRWLPWLLSTLKGKWKLTSNQQRRNQNLFIECHEGNLNK